MLTLGRFSWMKLARSLLSLQPKLLRVLQEQEFERLGTPGLSELTSVV